LADALGSARQVVARSLGDLRRRGVVETGQDGTRIVDPRGLAMIAGRWGGSGRLFTVDPAAGPAALFDRLPAPVVAIDASGDVIYANPGVVKTFGWQPKELIGESITRLLPPDVGGPFRAALAAFMAQVRPGPIGLGQRFNGRRADGSEFPAEIELLPVTTPGGLAVFATVIDVSYRASLRRFLSGRARSPEAASPGSGPSPTHARRTASSL
jgi:PAS domain S-box-containing protein